MQNVPIQGDPNFDWDAYEASCPSKRRSFNKKVTAKYPDARVTCHEPYALELYEKMMGYPIVSKDFKDGDVIEVTGINATANDTMKFELKNGLQFNIEMARERKFSEIYGIDNENCDQIHQESLDLLVDEGIFVMISTKGNGIKPNLIKGHELKIKNEFISQIKEPTSAYMAKVLSRNKGGFMVEVQGINAFLPGGLAAANKIVDFNEYLGKEIPVMIEDYLQDTKTFIVSNKKYIQHILPAKMEELNHESMYEGVITGTAKYGIFVEFNEIFTGLLHYSKMTPETRDKFKAREFKPGDPLNFWIKEITKDDRIILCEEDPAERLNQIDEFKEKNLGVIKQGKVVSIKPFGTLVKLEKDIIGLVSKKELKAKKKFFEVGDEIVVTVDDVQKDKIYLSLIDESEELHEGGNS